MLKDWPVLCLHGYSTLQDSNMSNFKRFIFTIACVTAGSFCSAATIQVVFDNPIFMGSGSDNVNITFTNPNAAGTLTEYVAAGRFQGTGSNLQGVQAGIFVDGLNDLFMYCYDIYQSINHGQTLEYTVNFDGELARTRSFLGAVNAVMNGNMLSGDAGYDPYAWLHPKTGYQGAAIQLGIWESKYESSSDWDLGTGSFVASALEAETTTWWNSFKGRIGSSQALDDFAVITLDNPNYQDMITADPPINVPEPGTLALVAAALAGLAGARRKKA